MRITCSIDSVELENDDGFLVDSICATCDRCGHETQSFGTSGASVRRCLVLMREYCPKDQNNYYVGNGDDN